MRPRRPLLPRRLLAGLVAAALMTGSTARASETTVQLEDIPTRLVVPSDPVEYPDPICLGCKIVTKRVTSSSSSAQDSATLEVSYHDPSLPTFMGDIVLTVLLPDTEQWRSVELSGVVLVDGQTAELSVLGGPDWTWDEVGRVLVEMREQ